MPKEREMVSIFKALSDGNRIRILKLLHNGEKCACKLLEEPNITQPALSHHMKILCDAGIVTGRKEGKWTHYSICCGGVKRIRGLMNELLSAEHIPADCACKKGYWPLGEYSVQAQNLVQLLPHGNHDPDNL